MQRNTWMVISGVLSTLLLVGTHCGKGIAEQTREERTQENSAKLAVPLKKAQDDLKAKRYPEAIANLKEAERISGKTPYDEHLINDMLALGYMRTSNYAGAAEAMEAEIDDGFTPQSDVPEKVRAVALINYQLKNYDKAIEFGERAIKGGFADDGVRAVVGQGFYMKGDWESALKFEEGIADNEIKAGETPKIETLQLILSSCMKLNDSACEKRARERLRRYYPGNTSLL